MSELLDLALTAHGGHDHWRRIHSLEGYTVSNYFNLIPEFERDMTMWIHEGKVAWKETVVQGIENAPTAFLKLFKGENFGKTLVKLG